MCFCGEIGEDRGEREGVRSFVRGRGSVEAKKVRVYKIVYRYGECLPYRGKLMTANLVA